MTTETLQPTEECCSSEEITKLVKRLDDIGLEAIRRMAFAMASGKANEESLRIANDYLISEGRKPIPKVKRF